MDIDSPKKRRKYLEQPGLQEVKSEIQRLLPFKTWKNVTVDFFICFWQFSLYDISVPKSRYESEIGKQSACISTLDSDRSDMSKAAISKRTREKERATSIINSLREELKIQEMNYETVRIRIDAEKDRWFADGKFYLINSN